MCKAGIPLQPLEFGSQVLTLHSLQICLWVSKSETLNGASQSPGFASPLCVTLVSRLTRHMENVPLRTRFKAALEIWVYGMCRQP